MTTKVKAQKFRVKKASKDTSPTEAPEVTEDNQAKKLRKVSKVVKHNPPKKTLPQPQSQDDKLFDNSSSMDGFGEEAFPGSAAAQKPPVNSQAADKPRRRGQGAVAQSLGKVAAPTASTPSEKGLDVQAKKEIEAIQREGLSGRQLRMARRVAQKHGIEFTSDFDAVRQLRAKGIDPFQRSAMLDLVSTEDTGTSIMPTSSNLPQKAGGQALSAAADHENRHFEISSIQLDIAKRRRRNLLLLAVRLLVFVGLPTFVAGYYFYNIATPMYATSSAVVIERPQAPSPAGGGLSAALSGSPLAGSQDSINVQNYLESKESMLRLDADAGFIEHFSNSEIDSWQRLPENATIEDAYKVYKKRVVIAYDPTEGLVKLEVVAADPETSLKFSEALINYAEERVNQMTAGIREEQEKGARDTLAEAENKMFEAQERIVSLQEQLGIVSADAETGAIMGQIGSLEAQIQQKDLQLQQLLDNARPNQARVDGVRGDIRRLQNAIQSLRSQLTVGQDDGSSLARITAELRIAEVDLQTRTMIVQQSIQSLEAARIESNRQMRFLIETSKPIAPESASYPRKFENTMLSLFVFCGIYLMASLTAAVLREQVSA